MQLHRMAKMILNLNILQEVVLQTLQTKRIIQINKLILKNSMILLFIMQMQKNILFNNYYNLDSTTKIKV